MENKVKPEVAVMKLSEMNPAAYNPRIDLKPGDEAYEKLKASIREFGNVEPIVWNRRTGNIVGGHQRFKVMRDMGFTETEVSVVDLPMEKEKVLNLALNNIKGENDDEKLKALLLEMDDLSRELTGVDYQALLAEADAMMEDVDEPEIPFTEELHEEHNYVVLYFDNDVDWINAQTFFNIKSVQALDSKPGFQKIGVGRVLNGAEVINQIRKMFGLDG